MASVTSFSFHLCVLLFTFSSVDGWNGNHHRHHHGGSVKKLFVFGDSYVDTGNLGKYSSSWKEPYGSNFPGKPAGRFSDGRVLTDYIASFLGRRSPLPYKNRKYAKDYQLENGLNFAYGGTGVFDTMVDSPNMTRQIDYFQQLLEQKVYTQHDLDSAVALVSNAGNDYITFLFTNGSLQYLPSVSENIVKQLATNLKRIHDLGVRKIAVSGLQPVGCLPLLTSILTAGKTCDTMFNNAAEYHNLILKQAVAKLNREADYHHKNPPTYLILDLYHAFNVSLNAKHRKGNLKFKFPLKQCCTGSSQDSCGQVDDKGVKQYEVCKDSEFFFFWDEVHPSQIGWHSVYKLLKPKLHHLYL